MDYITEIRRLNSIIDDLTERNRQLNELLRPPVGRFDSLHIHPGERRIIARLYSAAPNIVRTEQLTYACGGRLKCMLYRIRQAYPHLRIINHHSFGYSISLETKALITTLLESAHDRS
jgi:hypothetical protein